MLEDERQLILRQLELNVLAHEMALVAKRLNTPAAGPPSPEQLRLERELQLARARHAELWLAVQQDQRAARDELLVAVLGVSVTFLGGLLLLSAIASSGNRDS